MQRDLEADEEFSMDDFRIIRNVLMGEHYPHDKRRESELADILDNLTARRSVVIVFDENIE